MSKFIGSILWGCGDDYYFDCLNIMGFGMILWVYILVIVFDWLVKCGWNWIGS